MTIAYWILAGLLAVFYLYAGGKKIMQSKDELRPMMAWVDSMPLRLVRTIGVLEVLASIGLVLPPLTGVLPALAMASAVGLTVLQVGATITHLSRGEARVIGLNIALIAASAATIWLSTVWL